MMSGGLSSLKAGHTCLVVLSSAGSVDITGYSGVYLPPTFFCSPPPRRVWVSRVCGVCVVVVCDV
jgi:hypothetical protein